MLGWSVLHIIHFWSLSTKRHRAMQREQVSVWPHTPMPVHSSGSAHTTQHSWTLILRLVDWAARGQRVDSCGGGCGASVSQGPSVTRELFADCRLFCIHVAMYAVSELQAVGRGRKACTGTNGSESECGCASPLPAPGSFAVCLALLARAIQARHLQPSRSEDRAGHTAVPAPSRQASSGRNRGIASERQLPERCCPAQDGCSLALCCLSRCASIVRVAMCLARQLQ